MDRPAAAVPVQARRAQLTRWAAGAALLLASGFALGFEGMVVGIRDGDTLTVLVDKQEVKVRLASIDAPELGQPFGKAARQSLADLCHQKQATVTPGARDRYGRTVGDVSCDGTPAGAEQVRRGMAWVYVKYAPKASPLHQLQVEARAARLGLWADPAPTPPWDWRHGQK
jgi:endonuclease YncB( thermonuclease family)